MAAGIAHRNPAPAKAMEAAAQAEIPVLKRRLGVLDTIVTLAPLLGLLGTVVGMIGSFDVMSEVGIGQPHAVTGGVAEALDRHGHRLVDRDPDPGLLQLLHRAGGAGNGPDGALQLVARIAAARTSGETLMRIQRRSIKKARIEIIPMIDTIFFLLVFFMISTLSMTQFKGMPVNLPKAASGQQAPAESAAITHRQRGTAISQPAGDR